MGLKKGEKVDVAYPKYGHKMDFKFLIISKSTCDRKSNDHT